MKTDIGFIKKGGHILNIGDLLYWNQHVNGNVTRNRISCDNQKWFGIICKLRKDGIIVFAPAFKSRIKIKFFEIIAYEKSKDG